MAKHKDNNHQSKLTIRPPAARKSWVIITSVLVVFVGIYFVFQSFAAGTATFTLSPSSSSPGLNSNFTVTVHENSGTDLVNAVQANLTYPAANLQFVSVDYSTSGFSTQAQSTTGSGTIAMARGATTPISGDQIVAVITFKAIALGSAAVNFDCVYNASTCPNGNALIRSSDNGAETLTMTGGTYTVIDNTAPSIPTGLAVASHAVTSIGLSWTASTDDVGVTGYKIFRNGTQIATSATNSYTNTGLTPNTSYTYTVAAYDAANNTSAQSVGVVATTDPDTTAPTVPGTPTQTSRTMVSMVIGWTASTDNVGVTGYKVYRNGTQIATSATNSYTDNGLTPGTTYTYTVAAYDAANNTSAQSAGAALATAPDTQAPTVPSGLTVSAKAANSITLSWTASTDNVAVTGYKIYRNSGTTAIATVTTTTYQDLGLTGSTAYNYQVSAIDAAGNESAKSTVLAVTTVANGDLNGDGHVNIIDLSIFLNHWQQSGTGIPEDFNNDNIVNIIDLSIMLSNYGT